MLVMSWSDLKIDSRFLRRKSVCGMEDSMKRTITLQFILIVVITMISTLALAIAAFYRTFTDEIRYDLRSYAEVVMSAGFFMSGNFVAPANMTVTVLDSDGNVTYDTGNLAGENLSDRPDIKEAKKNSEGFFVEHIENFNKNMFYYSKQLDNGEMLRVGKKADSRLNMIYKSSPQIILIVIFMGAASSVLSYFLTKTLIKPLEGMAEDINAGTEVNVYKELEPFANMIKQQHEDILKNANMRQEFTANVSHELKTPLTSISGYAELIENGMATEADGVRFAGEIHKSSKRLLTLINDIIRLSELDVMDRNVDMEDVDIYDLAYNCVSMLQLSAERHEVTIDITGSRKIVHANKEMMEELIYNLCDNAIRYNKTGGAVDVSVNEIVDKNGKKCVVLAVKDTGIGISKEHQERIFERFYRVDKSRSKSTGGTGLGLAIVKHIVAQHHIMIELESERGKGTEIKVIF